MRAHTEKTFHWVGWLKFLTVLMSILSLTSSAFAIPGTTTSLPNVYQSTYASVQKDAHADSLLRSFLKGEFDQSLKELEAAKERAQRLADLLGHSGVSSAQTQLQQYLASLQFFITDVQTSSQRTTSQRESEATPKPLKSVKPTSCESLEISQTKLWEAITKDDSLQVEHAAVCGADLEGKDGFGRTPLTLSAELGKGTAVRALLKLGAKVNGPADWRTALHYAAMGGHNDVVRDLLAAGAKVEARSLSGLTPLHDAAYFGQVDTAKLLLENGAEVNARSNLKVTPLAIALEKGQKEFVAYLRSVGGTE